MPLRRNVRQRGRVAVVTRGGLRIPETMDVIAGMRGPGEERRVSGCLDLIWGLAGDDAMAGG